MSIWDYFVVASV